MANSTAFQQRLPPWLRVRLPIDSRFSKTQFLLDDLHLRTVCESAKCPNHWECWSRGTATVMIAGERCTRACGFCAVKTGKPGSLELDEPQRVAEAVERMGLRHVVITAVARDDLGDGGADHFARTIRAVKARCGSTIVEVLTSDFNGSTKSIDTVLAAKPEVFSHNIETVERLTPSVRWRATYQRSLEVLSWAKRYGQRTGILTKSGLMLGLGEREEEVRRTLADLRSVGCDIVTMGQYLRPTFRHLPVREFVTPERFAAWAQEARAMGFTHVAAGPFVRSSYHADEFVLNRKRDNTAGSKIKEGTIEKNMKKRKFDQEFIVEANRLKRLPPYLFTIMDDLKAKARAKGVDVIDLGMGSPDLPPPPHVLEAMSEAIRRGDVHGYSRPGGEIEKNFRRAIADWYERKFNVVLDPDTEVLPLIGAKEGCAHLSFAFLNHDDITLVPSPAYPVHFNGVIMAGGILCQLPLRAENNYLPELNRVDSHVIRQTKLLILSYPHNPTTAVADEHFFQQVVEWCRRHHIILAHDLAYSDFVYDGHKAPSVLETKGARDIAIEFHTLSKSYCMAGWRVAFAVGNARVLKLLAKTKSYIDFGLFPAIQVAATAALSGPQDYVKHVVQTYRQRTELFVRGLHRLGWEIPMPKSTFYLWAHIPLKFGSLNSLGFSSLLIKEGGIGSAPGTGFGEYGEGYIRFAMVQKEERLKEALCRIQTVLGMET